MNTKLSLTLTFVSTLACACSSAAIKPASSSAPINKADYLPPTDMELVVHDKTVVKQQEVSDDVEQERYVYALSLIKIQKEMETERTQLRECAQEHGEMGSQCLAMRREFCQADMLIDSKGRIHHKAYCSR